MLSTQAPASAATRYVAKDNPSASAPFTSWATAASNIQDAVDATADGDSVIVSNGVYDTGTRVTPGGVTSNRVVITQNIAVQSVNGPAFTSIAGASNGNSLASIRCVFITNGTLSGFTLTNGYAPNNIAPNTDLERAGGGAYAPGGTLTNCTLAGNAARNGGGTYYGTLNNCTLSGNAANNGGGTYFGTLNNCALSGNTAGNYGGGAYNGALSNCVLTGNSAIVGGGSAFGTLNNCTLSGNAAGNSGGGSAFDTLNNCIAFLNRGPTDSNWYFSTLSYSCTTPDPGGTGNITSDPLFVATNDFHLGASSPCIDAGNNAYATGATDLDGNPRIANGTVDMGAYESAGSPPPVDSDGDGFTDQEEYIADTQPTNSASYFPKAAVTDAPPGTLTFVINPTSTGRVYFVDWSTNLLASPQVWALYGISERTGNNATISFTVTNDVPGRRYRTGVRLP